MVLNDTTGTISVRVLRLQGMVTGEGDVPNVGVPPVRTGTSRIL